MTVHSVHFKKIFVVNGGIWPICNSAGIKQAGENGVGPKYAGG
jgi:hypothetical protein